MCKLVPCANLTLLLACYDSHLIDAKLLPKVKAQAMDKGANQASHGLILYYSFKTELSCSKVQ